MSYQLSNVRVGRRLGLAFGAVGALVVVSAGAGLAAVSEQRDLAERVSAVDGVLQEAESARFQIADVATTVDVLWAYIDRAMTLYQKSELSPAEAAKVKFWSTEREWEVLDACVQLFGGYGYITEYPITRAFLDARVHRVYGGSNEIMREIVAREVTGRR